MTEYQEILAHASRLPVDDRLRLIDELAASVPDDAPPRLTPEWIAEIQRRSEEIDVGSVQTESWTDIRQRLFAKHGVRDAD
ncbi:MAG: addiction module protein [Planctomycetaceae bacterium]|nr:addiction module protein [Planctomycetaceae bacterium]MCB9954146.1 addiction module protein [Planctomycetaceae bacterium]